MNFEDLEKEWARQTLIGTPLPAEALLNEMKRDVRSAQRRIRGAIVLVAVIIILDLVMAIVAHTTGLKRLTPLGFAAGITLLALYVLFLTRAARSARAVRQEMAALGGTLGDSAVATLRTIELQMENARFAAYAIPAFVAISAVLLSAKHFAGELRMLGVVVGVSLLTVLGLAIGGAIWHRYRTHLIPRRKELMKTLHTIERESAL